MYKILLFATFEGNWSQNAFRNCFWNRYWGHAGQLLANIFPLPYNCPGSLCKC